MYQKRFFIHGKNFLFRFKKWFFPVFIVAILSTTLMFGLLGLQRQKLSNEFVPNQPTITITCQDTSKSCLSNTKKLPFVVEHFFQGLFKTLFIDFNSKSDFKILYKKWLKTIKFNQQSQQKIIFQSANSSIKVNRLFKDNHQIGYMITLLNGTINEKNWFALSNWIKQPALQKTFGEIFNFNLTNITKKFRSNRFFNQIDYRLLIFILIFTMFGLFAIGVLIYFGAGWGFFNLLFNLAFLTSILLIFNHFEIILTLQNLILLFFTWLTTIYWQFHIMRQSQNFTPQKSLLKTITFNLKLIKPSLVIFTIFTISFLAYFLLVYPEPSKKLLLASLNISNHFNRIIFDISIPLLIIWISFLVGFLVFFYFTVLIAFFLWQPMYQQLFFNYQKHPQSSTPLSNFQPKSFVINYKIKFLTSIGLFLLIVSFITLIPFLAKNVLSNHLLSETNLNFDNAKMKLKILDFFEKWKLYLIVLLLTFVALILFALIFLNRYATLWFIIETLFMVAFCLIIPITLLITFQPFLNGGLNEFVMLFTWILIISKFTQMFLHLFSANKNANLLFSNIFKHYNWKFSIVKIGLISLFFSFLWKNNLWLYVYLLTTLLIGELFTVLIKQPYLAIFTNWQQNHQNKRKKMYIEYKKQAFFEREIEGIND